MKKLLLFIFIILGFVLPNKVNAIESSFYEGEYLQNFYIKKFKNNSSTGKYEQMRVFRRKEDNRVVYCLEIWEELNSNKNIIGYDENQLNYTNLDSATWNKVVLIAYYGYNYLNHTDIKWYGITQYMIWKEINKDSDIYFTDTLNGNRVSKYEDEINEINNLINTHYTLPNFKSLYRVAVNKPIELVDSNNVLNQFHISADPVLSYKRNGNKLEITALTKKGGYLLLYKQDNSYNNDPVIYVDNDGQNLLLPGKYPRLYKNLNINVSTTNLTINKYDNDTKTTTSSGEASFDNVTFGLYDLNNKLLDTAKLANNKAIFTDVAYGEYYVKELSPGIGYTNNNEKKYINIDDRTNTLSFYNTVIKNKIKINKYLKEIDNVLEEKDAVFRVINNKEETVLEFNTDENGYYEFILPYGTYRIEQVSGKKNYKYIDNFNITVIEDNIVQEFNLYNEELIVPIQITNIDSESKLPILEENIEFTIKNKETNIENTYITDNTGKTEIINLTPGTYEIKQSKSSIGYIISNEIIELVIDEDNFDYDSDVYNINIENDKSKSKIEVSKLVNYYLDDKLIDTKEDNDISISIYAKDDIYTKDGIKRYGKDEEVDVISKDNNLLSKELIYGNYYINNKNEIINLSLNNPKTKEVKIIEDIYAYSEIDDVPNTYTEENNNNYLYIFMIALGLYLLYWSKKHENN